MGAFDQLWDVPELPTTDTFEVWERVLRTGLLRRTDGSHYTEEGVRRAVDEYNQNEAEAHASVMFEYFAVRVKEVRENFS